MKLKPHSLRIILPCSVLLIGWLINSAPCAPIPRQPPPIRVLYVQMEPWKPGRDGNRADMRLPKSRFTVKVIHWKQFEAKALKDVDVLLLPTGWAWDAKRFQHLESRKESIHAFLKRGGGILVCQPNPEDKCTPTLLPYPITFQNGYDESRPERVNLAPEHFITEDVHPSKLPFPADPMIKVDPHYKILAKQKSTGWPSLAICEWGQGRVVVQTANESTKSTIPIGDAILRRMVIWAAHQESFAQQK